MRSNALFRARREKGGNARCLEKPIRREGKRKEEVVPPSPSFSSEGGENEAKIGFA